MDVRVGLGIFCFSPFFAQTALFRGNTAVLATMTGRARPSLPQGNSGLFLNSKNILNKKCGTNQLKS